jgi:tRNA 2-thiouridine synthesizing protein A
MDKPMTLDVRGLSCPQPALLATQTLGKLGQGAVEVQLDSATSRDNVSRVARNAGWHVSEEQAGEGFRLVLTK